MGLLVLQTIGGGGISDFSINGECLADGRKLTEKNTNEGYQENSESELYKHRAQPSNELVHLGNLLYILYASVHLSQRAQQKKALVHPRCIAISYAYKI